MSPVLPLIISATHPPERATAIRPRSSATLLTGTLSGDWSFKVFDRGNAVDPSLWRTLFPADWKDRRYYQTLEKPSRTNSHNITSFSAMN